MIKRQNILRIVNKNQFTHFVDLKISVKCIQLLVLSFLIINIKPISLYANENGIRFEHISLEKGLSQSSVHCILQDSKGFMWFGTEDGLNKYDGYDFKVYKYDDRDKNSLSDNFIWTVYEDDSGNIWIGTGGGGLNKYIPEEDKYIRYEYNPNDQNSISYNIVRTILEDSRGILWVGTEGGGLCRFDHENNIFTNYQHDPQNPNSISSNNVLVIYEDRDSYIWVGTGDGGLNRFDPESEIFSRYVHNPDDSKSISGNTVMTIFEDRKGMLWIGTVGGGLNKYFPLNKDKTRGTFIHYKHEPENPKSLCNNSIMAIYEDSKGIFWVGTRKGIAIFDKKNEEFHNYKNDPNDPNSLSHNDILSIYEDNCGAIWIGTTNGGINKYDRNYYKFKHYKSEPNNLNSLNGNVIRSIYEDKSGIIWIGTIGGGINRFDRKNQKFTHYSNAFTYPYHLEDADITVFCEDRFGNLWIGSWGQGLFKFDKKNNKFSQYKYDYSDPGSINDNHIQVIYEDRNGVLWVGTDRGGLNKFDFLTEQFYNYKHDPNNPNSISSNSIQSRSIIEDEAGYFWIGTWNGLNKFDPETGEFTHFLHDPDDPNSINNDHVISIIKCTGCVEEVLWIGTTGGLNKFNTKTHQFTKYTQEDGLPNNVIYAILEDNDKNLWISTNNGLSKFNPYTETFKNYDIRDGLQSNQYFWGAACKTKSGELLFGGINGFNIFHPDSIKDNLHVPPIYISSFKIFNDVVQYGKDISTIDEIILSYKENYISFEFVALNYILSEKNQYAYYMEGVDKDWIYSGTRRYASYTNLEPGEYTFRIKASNNDNIWNEEGIAIKVEVIPPFWKKWWFKISVIGAIALLFIIWYEMRIYNIRKQKTILEVQVAERTKELQEKNLTLIKALKEIKKLGGLLPICASCKKIRNDEGYWQEVENYIHERSEAEFTHGICPDCMEKLYPEFVKKIKNKER